MSSLELEPRPDAEFVADLDGTRDSRRRYVVLLGACSLAVIGYLHRVGFATAAPEFKTQLGLNDRDLSYLMAVFMVAYGLVEIPCGLIGDKLGVRNLLAVLVIGWSLLTGALAWATLLPVGTIWPLTYLLVLRGLFGLFQGGMFPSISRMMTDWMPIDERASAQGFIWMSSRMGGALAPLIVVALFHRFGTGPATFWSLAAVGAVWVGLFWPWFRNRPEEMPGVNAIERKRIAAGRSDVKPVGHLRMPWRHTLTSLSVWSLCGMYGTIGFTGNFFITLLPSYLRNHRGLDPHTAGWLSSLPLACGIVACVLGGFVSDGIIRRTGNRKWGRRASGMFGLALASLSLFATIWARDPLWLGVLLCATFFGNDLAMGPAWAACGDIGERFAGTLGGTMNMIGSLTGATAAIVTGQLLHHGRPVTLFVILAASYALGALLWLGVDVTKTLGEAPAET
jgi:ACS family glucarate transporter-like MFS transporter